MRRLALLLVIALLVAPLVAPVAASPQPTPVCRFCGGLFAEAARDAGVNATVAASEVDVRVRPDGSARWTVELELSNGSEALAASPGRLDAIGRTLVEDGYGLPEEPTFLDAELNGERVTLLYRAPDAGERHGGLLVVDLLHDRGRLPWYHVNADRFTVHGPPDTVVSNSPESGRRDGATVTWTGQGDGDWYSGEDVEGSPYVVFGPDRSAPTRLQAAAAVALATLPIVVRSVTQFLLFQTAIFAGLLGAVLAGMSRWSPRPRPAMVAVVLGGLGTVGVVGPVAMDRPAWIIGPALLALGLAGLGYSGAVRERLRDPRRQAIAVVGLLVACYPVLLGLHLGLAGEWADPPAIAFRAAAVALPLAAMVPLGGALAAEPGRIRPWFALTVLAFAAVPMTLVNLADPPTGLGAGVFLVALLALAVATPIVGGLGLAFGWSLGLPEPPND